MDSDSRDALMAILDREGPREVIEAVIDWAAEEGSEQDELKNRLVDFVGNFGYWR